MNTLQVSYQPHKNQQIEVGTLAYQQGIAYLQLSPEFIELNISLSPIQLKNNSTLQSAQRTPFNGLHGVFSDSLPDGWGLLLMDRQFRQQGLNIHNITPLDRLAFIGNRSMGALTYKPDTGHESKQTETLLKLGSLAEEALKIYSGNISQVTAQLNIVGGSPGGARPKATIGLCGNKAIADTQNLPKNYQHWLIKFPSSHSQVGLAEGAVEYIYSIMARKAGINFPETQLIKAENQQRYFACKRFDRGENQQRKHMHTLAGLIHADFRIPDSDYEILIKATGHITQSHADMEEAFRRMVFNILCGNRDDHTKNFSYLMDEKGEWSFSPAYDITFNPGINGHHSMSIMGQGQHINKHAITQIAKLIPLTPAQVNAIIDQAITALQQWPNLAKDFNIPASLNREIQNYIEQAIKHLV